MGNRYSWILALIPDDKEVEEGAGGEGEEEELTRGKVKEASYQVVKSVEKKSKRKNRAKE